MSRQILKDIPELLKAEVITEETAQRITAYYSSHSNQSANRLFIVFGILGALLVGMGIVLIIAHNWDSLPKPGKLFVGLFPMIIGQALCGYLIIIKLESRTWREGSATFLFFAVAVSISIVSQVYNIEGNFGRFLLVWMALCLPIAYVLRSSMASLLFITGITWYACEVGYFSYPTKHAWMYWLFLALILPFYYFEFFQRSTRNNFFYFHSWLLCLSVTISLGVFTGSGEELMMIAYVSLFSAFIIISEMEAFDSGRVLSNAYLVVGSLGVMGSLLILSFDWYWEELAGMSADNLGNVTAFWVALIITVVASILLWLLLKRKQVQNINLKCFAFILFAALFLIGTGSPKISQILTNLVILLFAVHTIRSGALKNHLGILNYGLLIITALILCRFFDTDFSFILRGVLFIAVGAGFFAANYYMIQKRKKQA